MTPTAGTGRAPSRRPERTRAAVVGALQELIREGDLDPSARRIAERAEVSTRSVFAHFATLEDLHQAVAEQVAQEVVALMRPVDPGRPLAERTEDLCAQRGRVHEHIGPFQRAAAAREHASPALAAARARGRQASHQQVRRVFAPELAGMDPALAARRAAAVDALLGGEAWRLLREEHGLDPDEATRATSEALLALLDETTGPDAAEAATGTTATPTTPGVDARTTGPSAAPAAGDDSVASSPGDLAASEEIEARIDRLVAALEAGTPADLVAPRLRELRAARDAAPQADSDQKASTDRPPPERS